MTYNEFYQHISDLPNKFQTRDLETYLLALYPLIIKNWNKDMDAEMLLTLLNTAFIAEPMPFDEEWLKIQDLPDINIISRKFTNPAINAQIDKSVVSKFEGFEFTLAVIRFQVAELHKMRDKQLTDKYRFFGIDSETGNRWYNFDPCTNLECGARGLDDNFGEDGGPVIVTRQTLGELLEMGRVYE